MYKEGLLEEGRELGLKEGRELGLKEGRELGLKSACIENAKNFFQNGASFELVRASIELLTDKELQAIYKDVTGKEIEE